MHVEKNVCDSLIGLLLNIKGKTKDGINARKDMVEMQIRPRLAPVERDDKRTYLPPACYTLSKKEKTSFCQYSSQCQSPIRIFFEHKKVRVDERFEIDRYEVPRLSCFNDTYDSCCNSGNIYQITFGKLLQSFVFSSMQLVRK